jgi:hypothetical protein
VSEKGQNELLGRRAMDFSTGEGGRVNGVRAGMRRLIVKLIVYIYKRIRIEIKIGNPQ